MTVQTRINERTIEDTGSGPRPRRAPAAPVAGWTSLGAAAIAQIVALAALFAWFYGDHLRRLFVVWQEPDWSHGFLIPVFCLYLLHGRRHELITGPHAGSLWGAALMLLAIATYAWSIRAKIGYPQPLTMIVMLAGIVLLLRGWRTLWLTAFPIAFLALAIPPPDRLYKEITQPLQQGAAAVGAMVLNAFPGASVERAGINLAFFMDDGTEGSFTVAGACSGMRSLMAFVALGLMTAYLTPRPAWQRIAMALLVIPVALFCNCLRVIITGAFQMYGHKELASGTPHAMLGFAMFGLGFAIYMGLLWIMDHIVVEDSEPEEVLA